MFKVTDVDRIIAERRHRVLEAIREEIEPAAREAFFEEIGPISMAISMKRIADFICGTPDPGGKMDVVAYLGKELTGDGK